MFASLRNDSKGREDFEEVCREIGDEVGGEEEEGEEAAGGVGGVRWKS